MGSDEVFEAIRSERAYQDALTQDRTFIEHKSVGEELVLLQAYINKAINAWTDYAGDENALEEVRKIAAIATRCMEHHGVNKR